MNRLLENLGFFVTSTGRLHNQLAGACPLQENIGNNNPSVIEPVLCASVEKNIWEKSF
jgi:hypothetical protein